MQWTISINIENVANDFINANEKHTLYYGS